LHIVANPQAGQWLAAALAADSAVEIVLEEARGTAAGLARLRNEIFDAVLVGHEPGKLDALDLVEGYRAGGADDPIVIFGSPSDEEMAALCSEVGADGYVSVGATRNLIWVVARAVRYRQLIRENKRLAQAEQSRLTRQRDEALDLLQQQWAILESTGPTSEPPAKLDLSPLLAHYRELLRTYVIMGMGNLSDDLRQLARLLVDADIGGAAAMRLHVQSLDELVRGLGARSARHVMDRADLLALELMLQMTEGYRRRYRDRIRPPQQRRLPGFE